ncbi:hypothetical protein E4T56_gene19578 [Termitomyces sp. T112]|nr:hypothetical protein E4T56_gene19578 [Termitomyces sp. T112]
MPHANTSFNKSSSKHVSGNKQLGWKSFLTALKLGVRLHVQHGKELTGPLKPFYNAEKLIPWVVNPFLELNAVFMHGLIMDGLLNVLFLRPGVNDMSEELTKMANGLKRLLLPGTKSSSIGMEQSFHGIDNSLLLESWDVVFQRVSRNFYKNRRSGRRVGGAAEPSHPSAIAGLFLGSLVFYVRRFQVY